MVYEKEIDFLLNYDYTEIEKVPSQINSIDQTTKAILEELQKDQPLEIDEPTEFEMRILEVIESDSVQTQENPADQAELITEDPIEEVPVEEVSEEEVPVEKVPEEVVADEVEEVATEEVTGEEVVEEEVPVEEEVDYLQLLYQEMKTQNELDQENHDIIVEHLEILEAQGSYTNEIDGMTGLYLMWIVPFLLIILLFSKLVNPFLRG